MPIGKDSITKRVAKVETTEVKEQNIAPELVATVGVAPAKAPAKKTTSTAKKSTTAAKKPSATNKPAAANKPAEIKAEPEVTTGVLSNIAPETVEAVIGHKEDEKYQKVQIGEKMPTFLM